MSNGYRKRFKWGEYSSDTPGMRALGTSDAMKKAAGRAASAVVSAANSLDPKGNYSAKGVGVFAGRKMEPRHGAVVEGGWWPGARTAALQRAMRQVAAGQRQGGSPATQLVDYTRKDGVTIQVTKAQRDNWERMRGSS